MTPFEATMQSLLDHVVDYVGKDRLSRVVVAADSLTETAEISILLKEQVWSEQERAIDRMIEIREMFMEEVSIDYFFLADGEASSVSTKAHELLFA